jgi:ribosomal protein L12E/L44/L45/RPP1/RPP2
MATKKTTKSEAGVLCDPAFVRHLRNAAATEAVLSEAGTGLTREYAESLIRELSDDDIAAVCESEGLTEEKAAPLAAAATDEPRRPIGRIIDIIKNIDPALKKAILDAILRLIGLRAEGVRAAGPAESAEGERV